MLRHFSTLVVAVVFGLSPTLSVASAQSAVTGTLSGHLTWCKPPSRPVIEADPDPALLADVTPAMGRALAPAIRIPAANVQMSIRGTSLTAVTDATGGFTLSGVPAAQSLTLVAMVPSGPPLVLSGPSVAVAAGQTRDLGNLGLAGCGDGGIVLTVEPAPATNDVPGPGVSSPAVEDSAVVQVDATAITDDSN